MEEVIIVGAGPIGSGAAYEASARGYQVTVIAPHEVPRAQHTVWSSHYDEGRLTHRSAREMTLARWANQAIQQYRRIEALSGIDFYTPCGTLTLSASSDGFSYTKQRTLIESVLDFRYVDYSADTLAHTFPMLSRGLPYHGLYDAPPSGLIRPRRMVAAQLACAAHHGAMRLDDVVTRITPHTDYVRVETASGREFATQRVIVAAGAYSGLSALLPRNVDYSIKSEVVTLGEISATTAALLTDMPCMMVDCQNDIIEDAYLTPPLRYPDGKWYIKLGSNSVDDQFFGSADALRQWILTGDTYRTHHAQIALLKALFDQIEWIAFRTLPCVITRTAHGLPFIEQLHPRLTAVVGCNGSLAKSGYIVGTIAVDTMCGGHPTP